MKFIIELVFGRYLTLNFSTVIELCISWCKSSSSGSFDEYTKSHWLHFLTPKFFCPASSWYWSSGTGLNFFGLGEFFITFNALFCTSLFLWLEKIGKYVLETSEFDLSTIEEWRIKFGYKYLTSIAITILRRFVFLDFCSYVLFF